MTREEALKELAEWREQMKNHGVPDYGKKLTALGVAIEALENAPTESTNTPTNTPTDLISRQDAIEAFYNPENGGTYSEFDDGSEWYMTSKQIYAVLESLPSSDRPTGEWIRLEREENVYDLHGVPTWGVNYMCDKCGFITTAIQDHFGQYRWCPSCGEKKRGESHDA